MIDKQLIERYSLTVGIILGFIMTVVYDILRTLPQVRDLFSFYRDIQETFVIIFASAVTLLILFLVLAYYVKKIKTSPTILSEIIFDKEIYAPKDNIVVTLVSPELNRFPEIQESVKAIVSSSKQNLLIDLFETDADSGVFVGQIEIASEGEPRKDCLLVKSEDIVTMQFILGGTVVTKSVTIKRSS